jgi:MFS family permease
VKKKNITLFTVLFNKNAFFALLMCLVGTFDVTFYEGFLSVILVAKGVSEDYVGFIFGVNAVAYLGCCLLFEHLFGKVSRKLLFVISLLIAGFSMFLFGPSLLLGLPDSYWFLVSSLFFLGIVQAFFFIPLIPEMIERMQVDLNIIEGENEELAN